MNFYAKRIRDLQGLIKDEKIDALVVARPLETAFLTGFSMDGYMLLVSKTGVWAFTSKMLLEQFNAMVPFMKAAACGSTLEAVLAKVKEQKFKKPAFEPETETYLRGRLWSKHGFAEKKGLTSSLRMVKEGEELAALRRSCRAAAAAFKIIRPAVKTGRTEISLARELEDIMQAMGARGPSFNLIIGFGPNSALPHHESSARRLKDNEAVLIDFGCVLGGYCSDMTRTFFHGRATPEFIKVHSIVDGAQKAGVRAVKAGLKARLVDKACRDYISDAGYGQYFIHGTGHGIGLEIHEAPTLNSKSQEILKAGMAVTVEPGIYLAGKFGVRIEDSVLVRKNGCEILTR